MDSEEKNEKVLFNQAEWLQSVLQTQECQELYNNDKFQFKRILSHHGVSPTVHSIRIERIFPITQMFLLL